MIARVYAAINAVAAALAEDGVAKTRLNARDQYLYRSIDDVLERLAPLLAHHRLCILPRVLERHAGDRLDESGALLVAVSLKVAFDLVSAEDGSCHTIEAYGEALDAGDKATAKAMQSAYKYAVLQAFCVPAVQQEDADARSYRLQAAPTTSTHSVAEPSQGWQAWCDELVISVSACRDPQALGQLRDDHRPQLAALQRERPPLYRQVGEAMAARSRELGRERQEGSDVQVVSVAMHEANPQAPRSQRAKVVDGPSAGPPSAREGSDPPAPSRSMRHSALAGAPPKGTSPKPSASCLNESGDHG